MTLRELWDVTIWCACISVGALAVIALVVDSGGPNQSTLWLTVLFTAVSHLLLLPVSLVAALMLKSPVRAGFSVVYLMIFASTVIVNL